MQILGKDTGLLIHMHVCKCVIFNRRSCCACVFSDASIFVDLRLLRFRSREITKGNFRQKNYCYSGWLFTQKPQGH